jgi:hypothetical protein
MDREEIQREIRNALSVSDELGRHEHVRTSNGMDHVLDALRTTLADLDRDIGGSGVAWAHVSELKRIVSRLTRQADQISEEGRARFRTLMHAAERVVASLEPSRDVSGVPAKPLFDALPLARVIPQDVHSVMDYVGAATVVFAGAMAETPGARAVATMLGVQQAAVSSLTDYRLSIAKKIPIEMHELLDHVWGATVAAAPFVFGYAKKNRLTTALQVAVGLGTVALSLVTDYRASRGVVRPMRSRGGPLAAT